jgi:hypothetical protein
MMRPGNDGITIVNPNEGKANLHRHPETLQYDKPSGVELTAIPVDFPRSGITSQRNKNFFLMIEKPL